MLNKKLYLWEKGSVPYFNEEYGQDIPSLKPYLLNNGKKNGCVIVCPGGGYFMKAPHEGDPVSEKINSFGVSAFTLDYRCTPYKYPAITEDILRAIRFVRFHADEFNIDPNKIAVLGFSAGGHLAVSSLCKYDNGREDGDEIDKVSSRPDACVLCYGVLSMCLPKTHYDTMNNLVGGLDNIKELIVSLSGELNVTEETPPCFIWHTQEDAGVPVQNSLDMYNALVQKKIPSELHIFPYGYHGLGLSDNIPHVAQWVDLLGNWLDMMGFKK